MSFTVSQGDEYCSINDNTLSGIGVGNCIVTATRAGDDNYEPTSTTVSVNVDRAEQAPLFGTASPASIVFNGTTTLGATGGSGTGLVSFAVSTGSEFCSISGSILTGIGVGRCTVTVTKATDAIFNAATSTISVVVARAEQAPLSIGITSSPVPLTQTAQLSVSGGSGSGSVSFAVIDGATNCTVSGTTLVGTSIGSCTVSANKAGDGQFNPAATQAAVVIQAATDLEISLDDGALYVLPNGTVLYEILVANVGPVAVDGARLRSMQLGGLSDALWTCSSLQLASCPNAAGEGSLDQRLNLPVNGALRYLLSARVDAQLGSTLTSTATIESPSGVIELRPENNSASDSNLVVPEGLFGDGFEPAPNGISVPLPEW